MEKAVIALVALVGILVALGFPWLAIIVAFGGAMAIAAMPPSERVERKWGEVPVPEAGGYPGWDFWKANIEGATETVMKALRLGTGIHYAADALGDMWKKKVWDADVPLTWVMTPWGPMLPHKKADLALLYQLMSEAYAIEMRIAQAKDPDEVEKLQKRLDAIKEKIKSIYEKGES